MIKYILFSCSFPSPFFILCLGFLAKTLKEFSSDNKDDDFFSNSNKVAIWSRDIYSSLLHRIFLSTGTFGIRTVKKKLIGHNVV